ncbi:RIP metalloprotease RseP [Patescibacteria group bacterium]|nr:RIP metalloprotease RseP [Patescibacteria group bacterium]MBU2633092.1 RIP metalloprotease RseP [Patescibacteria group bacterium]
MSILLFIVALAVLILFHELGHFLVAKLSGTKVEEFGIGFPPKIFGVKRGETVYSVNWIPFGGFVKVLGEDMSTEEAGSFGSKPAYIRAAILFAGVFFNLILAWFLLSAVLLIGAPTSVESGTEGAHVTILEVQPGTPAEKAGFVPGDKLLKLSSGENFLEVREISETQGFIKKYAGGEINIEYLRGKEILNTKAVPSSNPPEGVGSLGIAMDKIGIVSVPLHKAVWEGLKSTVYLTEAIIKSFGALFLDIIRGGNMVAQVRGPVGIVGMVGTVAEFGFVYVLQFVALLSVNLAILNFIPFPALDGGRLLFLGVEAIKRSPMNQKAMAIANSVGFAILILLMLLVTYRDIARIVG